MNVGDSPLSRADPEHDKTVDAQSDKLTIQITRWFWANRSCPRLKGRPVSPKVFESVSDWRSRPSCISRMRITGLALVSRSTQLTQYTS